MKKHRNRLIGLAIFFFLVVMPFILYKAMITPSAIGFIKPEDTGSWLGYYGAAVAGILTLVSILSAVNLQRLQGLENRALEFRPTLDLYVVGPITWQSDIKDRKDISLKLRQYPELDRDANTDWDNEGPVLGEDPQSVYRITLMNKGKAEMLPEPTVRFHCEGFSANWPRASKTNAELDPRPIEKQIFPGESLGIRILMPTHLVVHDDELKQDDKLSFHFQIKVDYQDIFELHTYQYTFPCKCMVTLINEGKEQIGPGLWQVPAAYRYERTLPTNKMIK